MSYIDRTSTKLKRADERTVRLPQKWGADRQARSSCSTVEPAGAVEVSLTLNTTAGGPWARPLRSVELCARAAYQKLPEPSATLLQPPTPCVVQVRVMSPAALREMMNALPDLELAVMA